MTTYDHLAAVAPKLVEVSPGKTPAKVGVERGGVLVFHNRSTEMPEFEIVFGEGGPPNGSDKLIGTTTEPIYVHMPDSDKSVVYYVVYHKKGSHHKYGEGPLEAHSCPGCGS